MTPAASPLPRCKSPTRKEGIRMTYRERERMTLDFQKPDRGAVEETFYPWVLTCQRFKQEGMPAEIADGAKDITNDIVGKGENETKMVFKRK